MTIMQIAFRENVSVSVIEDVMKAFSINYALLTEYGVTMVIDSKVADLSEFDWALSMVCDMDQGVCL